MAKEQDYSRLAQVDYCIQQYYSRYLAGDVIKTFKYAKEQRAKELAEQDAVMQRIPVTGASGQLGLGGMLKDQAAQSMANLQGTWSKKTNDDIANEIQKRWYIKDKNRSRDLILLTKAFQDELFAREGGYEKFGYLGNDSAGNPIFRNKRAYDLINYADSYVQRKIYNNMIHTLAKQNVPHGSAEYICKKAVNESLIGMMNSYYSNSFLKRGTRGTFDSDLEEATTKLYNPSMVENGAALGISLAMDTGTLKPVGIFARPIVGGLTKGVGIVTKSSKVQRLGAKWATMDKPVYQQNFFPWLKSSVKSGAVSYAQTGAFIGALNYGSRAVSNMFPSEADKQNLILFNDKNAEQKIAKQGLLYRKTGSELIEGINGQLTKNHKIKTAGPTFNMTSKAYGNQILKNTKGYSYNLRKTIATYFDHQAIPYNSHAAVPSWMYAKSSKELRRMAASWYAIARQMSEKRLDTVKLPGGHRVGLKYVAQRAFDYAHAAVETDRATWARKAACERAYQPKHHTVSHASHSRSYEYTPSQSYSREANNVSQVGNVQQPSYNVPGQQQVLGQSIAPQGSATSNQLQNQDVSGWQKGLQENGMGDFGLNGQNLGYTLAMLPDMLISMFTGKNPNFKLENNYMPLSMILLSFFLRKQNPMLSMLFMGLGGVQLLNNSCKAQQTAAQKEAAKSKQFLRYADEPLNPRIQNPVIKGRSLVATIDGQPLVITIHNDEPIYCYQQGVLPINVLANSVLKSLDEQQQARSLNYDRQQGLENDRQQQLQIK